MANVEEMSRLSPFGCENPMPTFLLPGVTVQAVNSIGNGNHLRMSVTAGRYTVPMVYFGMPVKQFPFSIGDHIDVACALSINDLRRWCAEKKLLMPRKSLPGTTWQECIVICGITAP